MRIMGLMVVVLLLSLLSPGPARGQSLMDLLVKGPVVSVSEKKGRFESVLAVHHVLAPIETVWSVATDFEHYDRIFPKVRNVEVEAVRPKVIDLTLEIEVPGVNPEYTYRYEVSKPRWQIAGRWQAGDLKGSYARWLLVPHKEGETLLYYTTSSRNFNKMAQAFEDDQQTLTVGVNVSSALAVVKATKRVAEERWQEEKARLAREKREPVAPSE